MPCRVKVSVPASSANLGPGYDCLGMALNLRNELEVTTRGRKRFAFTVSPGPGCGEKSNTHDYAEAEDNLVFAAFRHVYRVVGYELPATLVFHQTMNVPITRGLGSSAAAIISGMFAANELCGKPLSERELLLQMLSLERHPDNIMAAWLGGIVVSSFENRQLNFERYIPHESIACILTIPDYEFSTRNSRQSLPRSVPLKDAVYNMSRLPFLLRRLVEGRLENLAHFMDDRLHQPYRKKNINGYDLFAEQAEEAGAAATILSGSGPTLLTICREDKAIAVQQRLAQVAKTVNENTRVVIVKPDFRGSLLLARW